MTPFARVQAGLCDPVRYFIKKEPHTLKKILAGRLRAIAGVSIVDEAVCRYLCQAQDELEIANWKRCPSKPGYGATDDDMDEMYQEFLMMMGIGDTYHSDMTMWDWMVKLRNRQMDCERRIKLAKVSSDSAFACVLWNYTICMMQKLVVLSDGALLEQRWWGWQPSGEKITSSTGSAMRFMTSLQVQARHAVAFGDDACEAHEPGTPVSLIKARYDCLGLPYKHLKPTKDYVVSFCSVEFGPDDRREPETWSKTLFRLLCATPDLGRLVQWQYEMRHSSRLTEMTNLLVSVGWTDFLSPEHGSLGQNDGKTEDEESEEEQEGDSPGGYSHRQNSGVQPKVQGSKPGQKVGRQEERR
jgi:hypothetical protein